MAYLKIECFYRFIFWAPTQLTMQVSVGFNRTFKFALLRRTLIGQLHWRHDSVRIWDCLLPPQVIIVAFMELTAELITCYTLSDICNFNRGIPACENLAQPLISGFQGAPCADPYLSKFPLFTCVSAVHCSSVDDCSFVGVAGFCCRTYVIF